MQIRLPDTTIDLTGRPAVMGILNVTPDSFSDGGQFQDLGSAVDHARRMIAEGADVIDIGGESTRPGSIPVPAPEQIRRTVPVIRRLRELDPRIPISIDTRLSDVAEAGIGAGANMINDVSALRDDPDMAYLAADRKVPVVLMHMQGSPPTMQQNPAYDDVVAEVREFLRQRIAAALSAGIAPDRILIDPGIGFGKTTRHNLDVVRRIGELCDLGAPVLIGPSRKRFLGDVLDVGDPADRIFGMAAVVAWVVERGVRMVRVHDVRPMRHVVDMLHALQSDLRQERCKRSVGERYA